MVDSLGDRMKRYEEVPRTSLTPRAPMIIRVDGRAFHTYTKRCNRPWDERINRGMSAIAATLLSEVSGAKIAYLQSDEVSLLVTDYDRLSTTAWFDGVAQKVCSVTAALATMAFNNQMVREELEPKATFDSRCFVVPREDVNNYFLWRQRDAERNSIQMLAQSHFSHAQLQGKRAPDLHDMLMLEKGINWNDIPTWQKRGWCSLRVTKEIETNTFRTLVVVDDEIPIFSKDMNYIQRFVNVDVPETETGSPT